MNMLRSIIRIIFHLLIYLTIGSFLLTGILRIIMLIRANPRTFLPDEVPQARVALVLGAGLNRDGSPGLILRDRVETAIDLYNSGKVEKILMSGDNVSNNYDEPGAMQSFAIEMGVPAEDIILDYAGRRTYDSCYRAKVIFGLDKVIVVTQAYHLPRALFLCNAFDIEADGMPADDSHYRRSFYTFWWFREILASLKAYWDVYISHPIPILGEPEPIFPDIPH